MNTMDIMRNPGLNDVCGNVVKSLTRQHIQRTDGAVTAWRLYARFNGEFLLHHSQVFEPPRWSGEYFQSPSMLMEESYMVFLQFAGVPDRRFSGIIRRHAEMLLKISGTARNKVNRLSVMFLKASVPNTCYIRLTKQMEPLVKA